MILARLTLLTVLATSILACSNAPAQAIGKTVLNSAVWITYEDNVPSATPHNRQPSHPSVYGGSGFLLFQGIGYTRGQIFLVTNKHVLPKEGKPRSIKIRVAIRDQSGNNRVDEMSVPIIGTDGKYLSAVRVHPDPQTDVAVIDITLAAFAAKLQLLVDAVQSHQCLNTSMLMTSERLSNSGIDPGSRVYVVGFPAALFDPRNVSPIVRIGYVATDPREGYSFNEELRKQLHVPEHIDGFLLDANVYPGASGSLVLSAPDSSAPSSTGDNKDDAQPAILGIVSGSIPIYDESLKSYERIGLGVVYSASTIREVIQLFGKQSD